jgi:hypothetical protein
LRISGYLLDSARTAGDLGIWWLRVYESRFSQKEVNNMNLTKNLGMLLLGIWLTVTGLLQVVSIQIPAIGTILALLAIVAGVLILMGR